MRTRDILEGRFPPDQYVIMEEVSDAAGFNRSRSADFMAVGLWKSRGLAIHGFEKKASRSDWLRELKNHSKAENIFQYCDYFWLLTTDEKVAKLEEIPASWGWLNIKNDKTFLMKDAPTLSPISLTKDFAVCMLRRAADKSGYIHRENIQSQIEIAKQEGESRGKRRIESLEKDLADVRGHVRTFEEASGIHISGYENPKKMGDAVRLIKSGGAEELKRQLSQLGYTARMIHESIQKNLSQL